MRLRVLPLNDKGYTLAELLVVLALGGLIVYLSSAIYLFAERYVQRWRGQVHLLNATQLVSQHIADELYRAESIVEIKENTLNIQRSNQSLREISATGGQLMINNRTYGFEEAQLIRLNFIPIADGAYTGTTELSEQRMLGIELHVRLATATDSMSATRMVMLRQPVMWNPLTN